MPAISLDVDGPAAPPRLNGELVFDAPWQSRSFAMAMALVEEGHFTWDQFRDHLIATIDSWESASEGVQYRYYERWQEALESIVTDRRILTNPEVHERAIAYAARPAGHDHGHSGHDHGHSGRHRH